MAFDAACSSTGTDRHGCLWIAVQNQWCSDALWRPSKLGVQTHPGKSLVAWLAASIDWSCTNSNTLQQTNFRYAIMIYYVCIYACYSCSVVHAVQCLQHLADAAYVAGGIFPLGRPGFLASALPKLASRLTGRDHIARGWTLLAFDAFEMSELALDWFCVGGLTVSQSEEMPRDRVWRGFAVGSDPSSLNCCESVTCDPVIKHGWHLQVLSNLNFGALRLDLPKSCAACKAVAKYIPKNLQVPGRGKTSQRIPWYQRRLQLKACKGAHESYAETLIEKEHFQFLRYQKDAIQPSRTVWPSAILMFPGAEFGFLSLPVGEGSHRIPGINNSSRLDSVAAPDDTISLGHSGIAASGTAVAIKSKKLVLVRGQLPLGRICLFVFGIRFVFFRTRFTSVVVFQQRFRGKRWHLCHKPPSASKSPVFSLCCSGWSESCLVSGGTWR